MTQRTKSNFEQTWISYVNELNNTDNEVAIISEIKRANRIVFIAKGRVGLATKMFMQRLSQMGYTVSHSEDLLITPIDENDLAVFVTASGSTLSSLAYTMVATNAGCRTLAITFNPDGAICKQCDNIVSYPQPQSSGLMKSYYEIGFIYIFEKIISLLPQDQFVHANFE